MELELATFDDIADELGKRSACANFLFCWPDGLIIGNDISDKTLAMVCRDIYYFMKRKGTSED